MFNINHYINLLIKWALIASENFKKLWQGFSYMAAYIIKDYLDYRGKYSIVLNKKSESNA